MQNHVDKYTITFIFLLLFIVPVAWADNNIEFIDKDLIDDLNFGIYEIVTPKCET